MGERMLIQTVPRWATIVILSVLVSTPALAFDLRVATFNTESDPEFTTDPVNVAKNDFGDRSG